MGFRRGTRRSGISVAKGRYPRCYPEAFTDRGKGRLSLGAGEGIRTLDPDLGKVVLYH